MRRIRFTGPLLRGLTWTPGQHVRLQVAGLLDSVLRLHPTWLPLFYLFAYAATFGVMGAPIYAAIMGPAAPAAIPIALVSAVLAAMTEVPAAVADPAGLTTLTEDVFGNGAATLMMPGSWTTESTREEGNGSQHAAEGPG